MILKEFYNIFKGNIDKMECYNSLEDLNETRIKGKEELRKGKNFEKLRKLDDALEWLFKAQATMNKYYPSNHIENKNIIKHIGLCLYFKNREDEAHKFLKLYIKLKKNTEKWSINKINKETIGKVYYHLGCYYYKRYKGKKSLKIFEKCKDMWEEIYPDNNRNLGRVYSSLASSLNSIGKSEESLNYYLKGEQIMKEALPYNHNELAILYNNIGILLQTEGKHQEALTYFMKCKKIWEEILPPNHIDLARLNDNIRSLDDNTEISKESLDYYMKQISIMEETHNPNLFTIYNNLGILLEKSGNEEESLIYYLKCKEILENDFISTNHPDLAKSYKNLGNIAGKKGDHKESLNFYLKCKQIQKKCLSYDHLDLAMTYSSLGSILRKLGDREKSLKYYLKSIQIQEKLLPPIHLDLAQVYNSLGCLLITEGNNEKAFSYFFKCKQIREELLPLNHNDLAAIYNNLGSALFEVGKNEHSWNYLNKCKQIWEEILPCNHHNLAEIYQNLGAFLENAGDYEEALELYLKSKNIIEDVLPSNHPDLAKLYNHLGEIFEYNEEIKESLIYYLKAKWIYEEILPPNHPDLVSLYNNLGIFLRKLRNHEESLNYFFKAKEIAKEVFPSNHANLGTIYNNLGNLLNDNKNYEDSLKFYLKCKQIWEEVLPSNDINLARIYSNIANSLKNNGKDQESLNYSWKSQLIIESTRFGSAAPISINVSDVIINTASNNILIKNGIAIKKFENEHLTLLENQRNARSEYEIMKKLNKYKNFIKPICYSETVKGANTSMKIAKYNLFAIKQKILTGNQVLFTEPELKQMLQKILEACSILKKEKIVHSDVHPGNILIGFDNKIKICDFEYSYICTEEIIKDNEPLITPKSHGRVFLAPELFFWSEKLSSKNEGIRFDPFKADIFSVGLCILFLIHPDFKDWFDLKEFNDYHASTVETPERKLKEQAILNFFRMGVKKCKAECSKDYIDYKKYIVGLQEKINEKIKSLSGYRSIKKILTKMLRVHFPYREDADGLLMRVKKINFDIC